MLRRADKHSSFFLTAVLLANMAGTSAAQNYLVTTGVPDHEFDRDRQIATERDFNESVAFFRSFNSDQTSKIFKRIEGELRTTDCKRPHDLENDTKEFADVWKKLSRDNPRNQWVRDARRRAERMHTDIVYLTIVRE